MTLITIPVTELAITACEIFWLIQLICILCLSLNGGVLVCICWSVGRESIVCLYLENPLLDRHRTCYPGLEFTLTKGRYCPLRILRTLVLTLHDG